MSTGPSAVLPPLSSGGAYVRPVQLLWPRLTPEDRDILTQVSWGNLDAVDAVERLVGACRRRRTVQLIIILVLLGLVGLTVALGTGLALFAIFPLALAAYLVSEHMARDALMVVCMIETMRLTGQGDAPLSRRQRRRASSQITIAARQFRNVYKLSWAVRLAKAQEILFNSVADDGYEALVSFNASVARGGRAELLNVRDQFARALLRLAAGFPEQVTVLRDPFVDRFPAGATEHSRLDWLRHPAIPGLLTLLAAVIAGAVKVAFG